MLAVRPARESDVVSLVPRLRAADLREIHASGSSDPERSLLDGLRSPGECLVAVTPDDTPQIIFGTGPTPEPLLGTVWMMATDAIQEHRFQLQRESREWLERIRGDYTVLFNCAHAENTVHLRWVAWLGFKVIRQFNFNGNTFYEFAQIFPTRGM